MNRLIIVLLNVLAMLMFAAVLASHLFHVPALAESTQTLLIVFALFLVAIGSIWPGVEQKQGKPR